MANLSEIVAPSGLTSRRRFLGLLGVGVAGVAMVASLLPMGKSGNHPNNASEFPGPGSIFHPAQDPRSDTRQVNG